MQCAVHDGNSSTTAYISRTRAISKNKRHIWKHVGCKFALKIYYNLYQYWHSTWLHYACIHVHAYI